MHHTHELANSHTGDFLFYFVFLCDAVAQSLKGHFAIMEDKQSSLFELEESQTTLFLRPADKGKETELSALDEMFRSSGRYRQSRDYLEMLNFISRFRHYSPFNCMLVYIQNPSVSYFASARDWESRFNRRPSRKAHPLVALQPFGPVMFLFDLEDTEGDPLPDDLAHPFKTEGFIPGCVLSNTIDNCSVHGIEVRRELQGVQQAGLAIRLDVNTRRHYAYLNPLPTSEYLVLLNQNHTPEEQYSSLVHELAHVFCGHLGVDPTAWWESNQEQEDATIETEAESVAYLVCRRWGLITISDKYLSSYRHGVGQEMPPLGLNSVLQATDYIEKLGESHWTKPKRKPKRER
jgi:hypothetical protein